MRKSHHTIATRKFSALTLALLVAQGASMAQPVGAPLHPTTDALKRNQDAARDVPGVAPQAAGNASNQPRELGKPEDDIQIDVKAYQIDGLPGASAETLAALKAATAPYVGKDRHFEDLSNAVAAVTLYLQRDLGYYVGMAYLPEQNPTDGVVHIAVLEGRLDQIKVNWSDDLPVKRSVVDGFLSAIKPGDVLRVDDVERMVFLINDLPGIRTRFEIEPGSKPGTASLIATPQAEARVSGTVDFDTLGSRYTGISRVGTQVAIASPMGLGDSLVLHARTTTSTGLYDGGLSYVVPVGANGLKLGTSVSGVSYRIDPDYFEQDLHGTALAANVFGTYPLVRSRNLNVFGLATYEYKRFDDQFDDDTGNLSVRKSSNDVLVGVLGDFRDTLLTGAVNTYEATWLQGRMSFDPVNPPEGLRPSFGKLGLGYSRLQNIVSGRLQFYGRYKGQIANANLDATERMALGGGNGIRAFGPGEGTADDAHLLTAELRLLPSEAWLGRAARELAFSTFYDWGHAKYAHDPIDVVTKNTATLAAYGFGVIWQRPADFTMRFDLAWRAQGQPYMEPPSHLPRANIVLTKNF